MVAALTLWSCPSPAATQPTAAPQVEDGIPIYVNVPQVFQQCDTYQAPPILLVAIANIESGRNPYVINDNTLGRAGINPHAFYFEGAAPAIAKATLLLGNGDNVDMGEMQVNSIWVNGYGHSGPFTVDQLFDQCDNIGAGSKVFVGAWEQASSYAPAVVRAVHALSAYNSGSLTSTECAYGVKVLESIGINATIPGVACTVEEKVFIPIQHNINEARTYTSTLKRRVDDDAKDVRKWGANVWDRAKGSVESWTHPGKAPTQKAAHHSKVNSTGNVIKGVLLIVLILLLIVVLIYFGIIPLGTVLAWGLTQVGSGILSLAAGAGRALMEQTKHIGKNGG